MIRAATSADVTALGSLLAQAFVEDPFARWILDGRGPSALETLYRAVVGVNLPHRRVFTNESQTAVAVWRPPSKTRLGIREELALLAATVRTIGIPRFLRLLPQFLTIERRHPKGAYAQLVVLGVAENARGRGLASELLRSVLAECDVESTPVYLETSNDRNLPLYARHGFEVIDALSLPKGPPVWFMWRAPRPV